MDIGKTQTNRRAHTNSKMVAGGGGATVNASGFLHISRNKQNYLFMVMHLTYLVKT